ncbi:MAG: SpoVR family protein [Herminiimonas sp.]|nr:SpoVR family protein [Herminiimonas sp.]
MVAANPGLKDYADRIEQLAVRLGLDFYPVDFEVVPNNFMMEIAVYGLPVRMPHWSFGVRYIHQLIRQGMGHSRIFEVMFPGDPCHAYLTEDNTVPENTLVVAHVLGHADFAKNNHLFARFMEMAGGHILENAAAHAHRIDAALEEYGQERVEAVLDAALALEPHIDTNGELHRLPYPAQPQDADAADEPDSFRQRFHNLPGEKRLRSEPQRPGRPQIPPRPEYDLLWFIANYAPELEGWERDIFLAVREESFYFYPVFACQIMNEGWASYWHARLLREADFLPHELYLSAIKAHSDVVRPFAADNQLALAVNPYHLGFSIWEDLIEKRGLEAARRICREEDDFGFIRNYLDRELADKLELFVYESHDDGGIRIADRDIHAIREAILAPKFNYGAPRVAASRMHVDGSLELVHDHQSDGRGLDISRAERVLEYIARVWRRPVSLHTIGVSGNPRVISSRK